MSQKSVFFDPSGKRARLVRRIQWILGSVFALIAVAFAGYLLVISPSTTSDLTGKAAALFHLPLDGTSFDKVDPKSTNRVAAGLRARQRDLVRDAQAKRTREARTKPVPAWLVGTPGRALSMGFYANWDDDSLPALKRALPQLDWVLPAWLNLQGPDMALHSEMNTLAVEAINQIRPGIPILPMIQNSVEGSWDGPGLARLLADPAKREARMQEIIAFLETNKMQGLTVDFETVPPGAQKDLLAFLEELSAEFDKRDWV
ncbi:MAG TPA: hypothetical protein VNX47_09500, partial [Nevskia sp.]|nr:hypothetical protein [Nevskia sp.]